MKLLMTRWQTGCEVAGPDDRPVREPGIARALGLGEQTLRRALDRLAFETHEAQAILPDRDDSPADISRERVIGVFESLCPQDLNPRVLLEYLETRAGLLIARREGVYAFPHRTFQEYLAACHLADTSTDLGAELRSRIWSDPQWWREVYLLGVGKKRQGGLGDAVNLVNALVPTSPAETDAIDERHWQAAALGARALVDLGFPGVATGQPHYEAMLGRVRRWLVDLVAGGRLTPKGRLEAGDLLGRIGDTRPGVGLITRCGGKTLPDIDWVEVPAGGLHRAQVLLGAPGSGKSTFVAYLANTLATGDRGRLADWPEFELDSLPLLVILRDLAAWAGSRQDQTAPSAALLWAFIRHDLAERNLVFVAESIERMLDQDQVLILLDGLDEVPPQQLDLVRGTILAFVERYPGCRYLATCRVLSYRQPRWRLPEDRFAVTELAPFDEGRVDAFVSAWYREVSARWQLPAAAAQRKAEGLRQAVRRPDLRRLAPNPMLLTVMALVHTHKGELPRARALLYQEAVDILLWRWEREKLAGEPVLACLPAQAERDRGDLLSLLERLAFEAHGHGAADSTMDADRDAAAGIGELDLLKSLRALHPDESLDWAQSVIDALRLRAGLLVELQPEVFSLPHRTFSWSRSSSFATPIREAPASREPSCGLEREDSIRYLASAQQPSRSPLPFREARASKTRVTKLELRSQAVHGWSV